MKQVAVIDIGKTNAKVALVDVSRRVEIAVRKVPNQVRRDGPYPHHDVERLWSFICDSLADLASAEHIDAITVTTHGATGALVAEDGSLALPILDYEHELTETADAYAALRPAFEETGSPPLPVGLNLGAQLYWQQCRFPVPFAEATTLLTYPQYWIYRLTGVRAGETTSLGCHTDLWNPRTGGYSTMVDQRGWRHLMPPIIGARDRVGILVPDIAARTGLPVETPVYCGIHDSNASLVPHLLTRPKPFSVVSTGTWVVSMAVGVAAEKLDPRRDTLINVNADGEPVPSARFMGGREFEMMSAGRSDAWTVEDLDSVLAGQIMLLPSVQPGSGPFPDRQMKWFPAPPSSNGEYQVALSFYLALMTTVSLDLINARGTTIIEGPLARNSLIARMLASATGRSVHCAEGTGTAIGASLLAAGTAHSSEAAVEKLVSPEARLHTYAKAWLQAADAI